MYVAKDCNMLRVRVEVKVNIQSWIEEPQQLYL